MRADRDPHKRTQRYGLRFFREGHEVRLLQIGGGGRIRLMEVRDVPQKTWWTQPPRGVAWEVFEVDDGQTYSNRHTAESVAGNLLMNHPPRSA